MSDKKVKKKRAAKKVAKPKRQVFSCRFEEDLMAQCDELARRQRTSRRAVIEQCILLGLSDLQEAYRNVPPPPDPAAD